MKKMTDFLAGGIAGIATRRLLTVAATAAIAVSQVMGVPAKRGTFTVTQPDGSTLTVSRSGDERFHCLVTTDGLAVMKHDGAYRYITTDGVTSELAHDPSNRSASELEFLSSNMSIANVQTVTEARLQKKAQANYSIAAQAESEVPTMGASRIPVLLVQYQDVKFLDGEDALQTFETFFQEGVESARQYFVDQSNGKYTPDFDVYGPFTTQSKRATYGGNDVWGNDKGVGKMVAEAVKGLASDVDYSIYDNDGDGECDVIIVIYAGVGEASSEETNAVWPCQWTLSSSDYGQSLNYNNVKINKFAVFNELNGLDDSKIDGIGTFCHEFSHCLGLPDFYPTNYGNYFGMNCWSLMDYGCYNNDGYTPVGYSAYEKAFMNWIELPEAEEDTYYTLPVFNQKSADTDIALKITNSRDAKEYYILENRAKQGWDAYLPAQGMMVSHVTFSQTAWDNNTVNNNSLQRMTIIPADNKLSETTLSGDLWPYNKTTELTDTSTPAATVNTGSYMGKPITEITRDDSTGEVSLWFMRVPPTPLETPVLREAADSEIGTDNFLASWEGDYDTDVTYTLEVRPHSETTCELISDTDLTDGYADWVAVGTGYTTKTSSGIRLGSSARGGAICSPEFFSSRSAVSVEVTAQKYGSDTNCTLDVEIIDENGEILGSNTLSVNALEAQLSIIEIGMIGNVKVLLSTSTASKRVVIASVKIYDGIYDADATAAPARAESTQNGDVLLFSGITSNSHQVTELNGSSYDYRVRAIPTDTRKYAASPWTPYSTVVLKESGISDTFADDAMQGAVEYFNLQGIRISKPSAPGIYIRRAGNEVSKIRL